MRKGGRCHILNDDIENKRRELELEMSLANQHYMTDRSKYELIRKIMDLLEDAIGRR